MTEFIVADAACAAGPVRVYCEFAAAPSPEAIGHVNACLRKFILFGRCGGLRPAVDSPFSGFALATPCAPTVGAEAEARLAIDTMQTGAWYLLRNMLEHPEDEALHPHRVTVAPLAQAFIDGSALPRLDDDNEDTLYPNEVVGLPWPLLFIERSYSKSRRALIEFSQEVPNAWFDAMCDGIRLWADVLEAGGFSAPVGEPWELDSFLGVIQIFDAWTIEVEVSCFEASEMAWFALANVIDCYAGHTMPVLNVRVE